MKKATPLILLLTLFFYFSSAQQKQIDSLKALINTDKADTVKGRHLYNLARVYSHFSPVKSIQLAQEVYIIGQAYNNYHLINRSLNIMANMFVSVGDYTKAMQLYIKNLKLGEEHNNTYDIIQTYNNIGSTYNSNADHKKALQYLLPGLKILDDYVRLHKDPAKDFIIIYAFIYENIGNAYLNLGKIDLAEKYFYLEKKYADKANYHEFVSVYYNDIGQAQSLRGHRDSALALFRKAITIGVKTNDLENLDISYIYIAKLFIKSGQRDSAILYAKKGLESAQQGHFLQDVLDISKMLYGLYDDKQNIPEAYKYYKIAAATNDSVNSQDKVRELASVDFEERQRQQEIAAAKIEYRSTVRMYILTGVIGVALLLVFVFWRNALLRKKANILLQEQKEEIEATLEQLQQTQAQLIQSEKMASLGELTAGIAHEIQNPLNFVNNFSDVNREMLAEMKLELTAGNKDEAIAIADDIAANEEKINHHGKRADAIVKGMLQHSRAGSSTKENTDINKLAGEYLRLAYHGLRAKDQSFKANLVTNFADDLPLINIVPQDIGRVILNLLNNAFYATTEKQKDSPDNFTPTVELSTIKKGINILVVVKDNGNGIPADIKDKIMQPFFTTKPTGQGTGLGLSLSYEVVANVHNGKIDVMSKEGEYTEFIITLPL